MSIYNRLTHHGINNVASSNYKPHSIEIRLLYLYRMHKFYLLNIGGRERLLYISMQLVFSHVLLDVDCNFDAKFDLIVNR
jgi:hypothetical protein